MPNCNENLKSGQRDEAVNAGKQRQFYFHWGHGGKGSKEQRCNALFVPSVIGTAMLLAFWLGFSAMTAASEKTVNYSLEPVAGKADYPMPTGIKPSQFPPPPTKPSELLRLPKPPYVIWFQCPYLDDIRHCNVDASVGTSAWAFKNHTRGITSLMWTFGPNSPYAEKGREREFFLNQYSGFARAGYTGCAVDEWNVSDENPNVAWCAEGLRQTKKDFPDYFIAVWVTGPTPTFIALMKEGIIDLAIIEGYSYCPDHPEWAISWEGAMQRIEILKREGLLSKTVFCVGEVAAKPDQFGNRMTPGELTRQVTFIAEHYPEMPGIAFFGWNDQDPKTKELVLLADQLAGRLFVVK